MTEKTIERPIAACVEKMQAIVDKEVKIQTEKYEVVMKNTMLQIKLDLKEAIADELKKHFGKEQKYLKYGIDMVKFILLIVSVFATVNYTK